MILIVKGPKWKARLEAEKRGIVWHEDDPNLPLPETLATLRSRDTRSTSMVYCSEVDRDKAATWFFDAPYCMGTGYPDGTLLFYS